MSNHDAYLDAIVAHLAETGYLIARQRPDGGKAYQFTDAGARVARQLAMSTKAGQDALLEALIGVGRCATPQEGPLLLLARSRHDRGGG